MIHFEEHIFQTGWFNHHLGKFRIKGYDLAPYKSWAVTETLRIVVYIGDYTIQFI